MRYIYHLQHILIFVVKTRFCSIYKATQFADISGHICEKISILYSLKCLDLYASGINILFGCMDVMIALTCGLYLFLLMKRRLSDGNNG